MRERTFQLFAKAVYPLELPPTMSQPPTQPPTEQDNEVIDKLHELRWRIARSLAASYRANPRNLENPWYGFWQYELNYLIRGRPDFEVLPQYALYSRNSTTKMGDVLGDNEKRDEGENPDPPDQPGKEDTVHEMLDDAIDKDPRNKRKEVKEVPLPAHPPPPPVRHLECDRSPNASTLTAETDHTKTHFTSTYVPDFVVLHLCAVTSLLRDGDKFRYDALGGLQITHTCCPIIVEIKRSPQRKKRDIAFADECDSLLEEAFSGLFDQCGHYFEMFPKATSVIAIAASGAHWSHRIVEYREFSDTEIQEVDDVEMEDANEEEEEEDGGERDEEMQDVEGEGVDKYAGEFREEDIQATSRDRRYRNRGNLNPVPDARWDEKRNAIEDAIYEKREAEAPSEESIHPEDEETPRPGYPAFLLGWPTYLEIGTEASDTALEELRKRLLAKVHDVPDIGVDNHPVNVSARISSLIVLLVIDALPSPSVFPISEGRIDTRRCLTNVVYFGIHFAS